MFKIILVNMPFASVARPSIGLTQIKAVTDEKFSGRVSTEILYLNHDFAHYIGVPFYSRIADTMDHHATGLGDWLFRQAAFPELPDNTEEYFRRCYPQRTERTQMLRKTVQEKRAGLDEFINNLIDRYKLDEADLVGFSSTFAQNVACFALARKLKERRPRLTTVLGGANCESIMGREIAKQVKQIDYVFSGGSLKSFPDLVQCILKEQWEQCHRINGVFTSVNHSLRKPAMLTLEKTAYVGEIGDDLTINTKIPLDYDSFFRDFETHFPNKRIKPTVLFETSRGCWWGERAHCTFCGLNGGAMNYRAMDAENAIELFNSLFRYADKVTKFECVDNIMPRNYVKEVFPHIRTPPNKSIFYEVKADLSTEDLRLMAAANVNLIQPGIEALSTSTLKLMRKGTTVFHNLLLLKNCITYNIVPSWNLLVGFPGEGEDVYEKYVADLPLLTHLYPPSGAFPVRFDRFSPYHVQAKEYGLNLKPVDFYELTYPFDQESLSALAYYFIDQNFRAEYFMSMVKWIGKIREKIDHWLNLWRDDDEAEGTGFVRPKLYFKGDGNSTVIYDSRSGKVVEHDVGTMGRRVLECLEKPHSINTLAKALGGVPEADCAQEIARLQARGLVFQEKIQYLNLVHLIEPPAVT